MKTIIQTYPRSIASPNSRKASSIKVLLVGNNPSELGQYSVSLSTFRSRDFLIETAFSVEECFKIAVKFKPSVIVLDDSIGFMEMTEISEKLHTDSRYCQIPVIIIKNSNYHHGPLRENISDFITKDYILAGELPNKIVKLLLKVETGKMEAQAGNVSNSLDKRISKLLSTLFSSNDHPAT